MMIDQAHDVAINVLRPISRKYDKAEHAYPKELDMLASLIDGMNEGGEGINAGAAGAGKRGETDNEGVRNGTNMSTALGIIEMCYGDTGLLLSMPRQGLGNSAIAAVANDEQLERLKVLGRLWPLPSRVVVLILLRSVLRQLKMAMTIF